jgi:ubiquinone/menaquinone biosynthesis C-methylase UbiE
LNQVKNDEFENQIREGSRVFGVASAVDFFDLVGQTDWYNSIQRSLIHLTGLNEKHRILDAGCGAGRFAVSIAGRAGHVTGVDISEGMVRRAGKIAGHFGITNATFSVADIRALPFADDTFDLVFCANVLCFMKDADIAVSELVRVLHPEGQLILLNPSESLNPWSMQKYCEQNALQDFERDSLLSLAFATAKKNHLSPEKLQRMVHNAGGKLVENTLLLDDLLWVAQVAVGP